VFHPGRSGSGLRRHEPARLTRVTTTPTIDLLDPATFANGHPHEVYRHLRNHDPVHFHAEPDGPGFWVITRHGDVRSIGRDPAVFSSTPTIMIEGSGMDLGGHQMMLMMDPPRHGRFRRLLIPDFVPSAVAALRPRIAELATQIVDAVCEHGACDLVDDIAGEMPSYVIAEMLGLPLDDGRELYRLTETIHAAPSSVPEGAGLAAVGQMFAYASAVFEDRRRLARDDLSSRLAHATVEGREFDQIDFALMFLLLVDAGGDTTRNLVAGGIDALFAHRDELARFRTDIDGLMPTAMDELLRWVSPVTYMRRTTTADTTVRGQTIATGEKVVMYYAAANRDEAVFADPDRFDLSRRPNDHVAFGGGGPHFCLGAHLAKAEAGALLRELLTRLPDLEPTGPTTWLPSTFISGPKHLPVSFTPSPRKP
jgi:cytochrome P450